MEPCELPAAGQAFVELGERATAVWDGLDWRLALAAPVEAAVVSWVPGYAELPVWLHAVVEFAGQVPRCELPPLVPVLAGPAWLREGWRVPKGMEPSGAWLAA